MYTGTKFGIIISFLAISISLLYTYIVLDQKSHGTFDELQSVVMLNNVKEIDKLKILKYIVIKH